MADATPAPGVFARARQALAYVAGQRHLSYDVAKSSNRRKAPTGLLRSEDKELDTSDRRACQTATREIRRNFALAGWGIRKHLDYVATFSIRGTTPDRAFNRRFERWIDKWAEPQNFDLAARHDLYRWMRISEASRTVDGDLLVVKYAHGRVQPIESDRLKSPLATEANVQLPKNAKVIHGVHVDQAGKALQYAVHRRGDAPNAFTFERWVSAQNACLHGYYDRHDQIRGISPLAAAVNTFRDAYESIDYALAKAKVTQLFALVTFRKAAEGAGLIEQEETAAEGGEEGEEGQTETKYGVDFGAGPIQLDLDPGDDAKFLESASPAAEFQNFMSQTIALALKSLDIPYSFYAENFTNYSGSRQALLQYEQSASQKRRDNRCLLDHLTAWRLGMAVADGEFKLPAGVDIGQVTWEWQPAAIPWIDPLKEIEAEREALALRVTSRQRICHSRGGDFFDVADELDAEEQYLRARGLADVAPTQTPPRVRIDQEEPQPK